LLFQTSWLVENPELAIIESEDEIAPYNVDWIGKIKGDCKLVIRPSSTEEVSKVLKH